LRREPGHARYRNQLPPLRRRPPHPHYRREGTAAPPRQHRIADGSWSLPGGCLDEGETLPAAAAREALEEIGITIDPADLAFTHLCHHADPDGQARIGVFFSATRWTGEPVNAEPGKCSEIGWHDMGSLPPDIVSYISTGLRACSRNDAFSLDRW
jgi:8-oxo-dGTP pyrophosphatase MutT (NUDIX family)